jgi:5'-3' exonuclease
MGVPSFFRNIVKEYSGVTFWEKDKYIDHFFIDFNAMIYNVIRHIEGTDKMTSFEFENALLKTTLLQLENVITKIVKPQKSLLIAMDGPPPRAKMIQQRHRRYKGIKEAEFHHSLERKYNQNIRKLNWNKSAISPGTVFMKRLSDRIVTAIKTGNFNTHILSGKQFEITFSDSSVPGEGEHKILPLIHNLKSDNCGDSIAIYSPDADMIVLSMITHKSDIFIFKENEQDKSILGDDGNKTEFLYLSVDRCREGFLSELYEKYEIEGMEPIEISDRFLIDYSFLTFLCGNDFVIAIPYLKMKEGGMETLLEIYNDVFEGKFLVNEKFELNWDLFKLIIQKLADIELREFKKIQRKRDRIRRKPITEESKKVPKRSEFEPWLDEYSRFEHEYYYSPLHPHFETVNKLFDKLDYYKDNWRQRYNNHFFEGSNVKSGIICEDYVKSLIFCLEYYLNGIPSWDYFYPHRAAPTFSDLNDWLILPESQPKLDFKFVLGKPFTQFEQLLLVLPKISFGLLPKPLRKLPMGLEQDSFPTQFDLDVLLGEKYIYSEPILPDVNPSRIRQFVSDNLELLSDGERLRNTISNEPMKIIKKGRRR